MALIRKTPGARTRYPSQEALFKAYKASQVPEGGWTMEAFHGVAARRLTADLVKIRNSAILKAAREFNKSLAGVMRKQVEDVVTEFHTRLQRSYPSFASADGVPGTKAAVRIPAAQHEALWADALAMVLDDEEAEVTVRRTARAPMQSVASAVASRTREVLGAGLAPGTERVLQRDIDEMAAEVTNINRTTRRKLRETITQGIEQGLSPFEVMQTVRMRIPQIATNRVPTIVRTELGRAADKAVIRGMRDSQVVTHVSVSGCEAIEPGIPTFRGVPTCNIKNVPIAYAGDLRFHPNHTGAIIASGFKTVRGQVPNLPLRQGTGIGTWEDRGRPVPARVNEPPPST